MEVHVYSSVNAKSRAGNIWVKDIMATFFWPKLEENQLARDPKHLCILPENSTEDLGSRRERYCG